MQQEHNRAPDREQPEASEKPRRKSPSQDGDSGSDERYFKTSELLVGSAMIFIGFLNVFLSISSGHEINAFPLVIYFAGMALWAHGAVEQANIKYTVMAISIVVALAFFHYGQVLFWHKQLVFWGTIAMGVFFMLKPEKPRHRSDHQS